METIGKYRILGKLGEGGMGVVYKALDPLLERVVALKTISAHLDSEPDLRTKFFREGRSAAHLSHRNIITIYDLGEDNGTAYLAMEFLDGEDLKEKIRKKDAGTLDRRLGIMFEVCAGLAHAHSRRVIHRDIKPANVFITAAGQVKILDFGLARVMTVDTTRTSATPGSPGYMSPEQVRGDRLDHRTDVFSAGALLYELVTYRKPFEGESIGATVFNILHHDPVPPSHVAPEIPPQLDAVVAKALAKDPETRYESVREFMSALRGCSPQLASAPLPEAGEDDDATWSLSAIETTGVAAPLPVGIAGAGTRRLEAEPGGAGEISAPAPAPRRRHRLAYMVAASLVLVLAAGSLWRIGRRIQASAGRTAGAVEPQSSVPAEAPAAGNRSAPAASAGGTGTAVPAQVSASPGGVKASAASKDAAASGGVPGRSPVLQVTPVRARGEDGRAGAAARGIQEAQSLISRGKYREASAGLKQVLQDEPANPEALRLTALLTGYARKSADDALGQMTESKRKADAAAAAQLAAKSYEAAQRGEEAARSAYATGQFAEAAAGFVEAGGLYLGASLEAASEKAARENRARLSEQEQRVTVQRRQADASRGVYEQERLDAVKAGAETQAARKYQEATLAAQEAMAKWDREDYDGSKADFDRAADAMRQAKTAARDAAQKPEPAAAVSSRASNPAAPAPTQNENSRQAISAVLQQYAASLQSKDMQTLRNIWPGLGGQQERALEEEFRNAREIRVRLTGVDIKVMGDAAVATVRRSYTLLTVDGQRLQTDTRTVVDLRRNGNAWLIDKIRFEPL